MGPELLYSADIPAVAPPAKSPLQSGQESMKQREKMRELFAQYGNTELLVRAYAHAEELGEVERRSNRYRLDSEAYARALLADGLRKGWLK